MDWKIELIILPVTDVDRARDFYANQIGFHVDHDHVVSDDVRFVQLTPPGSGCSIAIGKGLTDAEPGSVQGLQIVVDDIEAARAQLLENGVDVGPVDVLEAVGPLPLLRRPRRQPLEYPVHTIPQSGITAS